MREAAICVVRRTRDRRAPFFVAVCCLAMCCLALTASTAAARSFNVSRSTCPGQAQNCAASIPDSQFAIGDFDGDRQPDFATVETAHFNPLHSRYWISFQLSEGRAQSIGVTGPAGGLVLLARDVNGDRALDLILVTAWRHEPVAVLLNDGRGNFAAADTAQFRFDTFSASRQFRVTPARIDDRTMVAAQYSFAGNLERAQRVGADQERKLACPRSLEDASALFASASFGRAPPTNLS
jgi:hypothetical protein